MDQFSYFFSLLIQKESEEEAEIKTATSPQICCLTTLRNVSGQLYSFTVGHLIEKNSLTINRARCRLINQ